MAANIWEGEKVRLRAWEPEDWRIQALWSRDTEGDRRTYYIPFPASEAWTRKQAEEHALHRPVKDDFYFIIETLGKEVVGGISMPENDFPNGTFTFGIYVAPEYRRNGYASEAVLLLCRYMFLEQRYQKGGTVAYAFNTPSQRLLDSLGFQVEGRQRRMIYSNGAHHDLIHYGLTIEEYREKHADWLKRNASADGP